MTDQPYTDADLRHEAARQLANLTEDPDYTGVGERMGWTPIPSRPDHHWDDLGAADFEAARDAIDKLLTNAADTSAWAVALGAAGLKPSAEIGFRLTTGGHALAVQVAIDPEYTDAARDELITALTEAINATAARVLGCTPVTQAVTQ